MRPPPLPLNFARDAVRETSWRGVRINVWHLYGVLTQRGWKVDTEESNLMIAMSKTWREEGVKVWVHLARFVCAPPDEVEALDRICFYRFDPAAMPTETMEERMYQPGDESQDWYPAHREEWGWLVDHGDAQRRSFALLRPIPLGEVPEGILLEAWVELEEAVELAE